MKKFFLSLLVILCTINTLSAQKPEAKIQGIEMGVDMLLTEDDPLPIIYAGLVFPTKFENINLTIGATYCTAGEGYTYVGIYSGIDGYWGVFTAGISAGLSTIGDEIGGSNLDVTISAGLRLGWKRFHIRPQLSMIMMGSRPHFGVKIPITITF